MKIRILGLAALLLCSRLAAADAPAAEKNPFDAPAAVQTVTDSFSAGKVGNEDQRQKLVLLYMQVRVDYRLEKDGKLIPTKSSNGMLAPPSRDKFLELLKAGQKIVIVLREDRPLKGSPDAKTRVPTDVKYTVTW